MAVTAAGLATHIWNNRIKSGLVLLCYPFLLCVLLFAYFYVFAWIGNAWQIYVQGHVTYMATQEDAVNLGIEAVRQFWPWVFVLSAAWYAIAWNFNAAFIRMVSAAETIDRVEEPGLYNMLENLCISRGVEMPFFQVIDLEQINAFATGVNRDTYSITLTQGLLNYLDDDEIEAVVAHELTHIINQDVRLSMINYMFAGVITFMADALHSFIIKLTDMTGDARDRMDGNITGMTAGIALTPVLLLLQAAKLSGILLNFSFSRKREYLADAGAVELTKNPGAMMRALLKIEQKKRSHIRSLPADIRHMCIHSHDKSLFFFNTHPPIAKRVERIASMTGTVQPENMVTLRHPLRKRTFRPTYEPFEETAKPK